MNIFFLSYCPIESAQYMADIHTGCGKIEGRAHGGKMIVESSQMLANAYPLSRLEQAPLTQKGLPRKHSYLHHPCSKWILASLQNWNWLLQHAQALVKEKMYRGGAKHFCSTFIDWCADNPPLLPEIQNPLEFIFGGVTISQPALAMPEQYIRDDVVMSYRAYYIGDKSKLNLTWTNRNKPEWYNGNY